MPKAAVLQSSFNSGELSPLAYGQTQLPGYKKGLETCLNYIPTLQGPLARRPGTQFMNAVKDSTKPPVLIPFQFSITQAYILEFGDGYVRFYANNGRIVASQTTYSFVGTLSDPTSTNLGSFSALRLTSLFNTGEGGSFPTTIATNGILELISPYAYADLQTIKYAQTQDTLYLFHPKYPIFKLQRFGQNEWQFRSVTLSDGPYLAPRSYAITSDNINVTLTTGSNYSVLPQVTTTGVSITSMIVDPFGTGLIRVTTSTAHKLVNNQKVFISGVVGTTETNNNNFVNANPANPYYWAVTIVDSTHFLLQGSAFVHAYTSGGTVQPAIFWQSANSFTTQPDIGRALAFTIGTVRYYGTIQIAVNAATANLWIGDLATSPLVAPNSTLTLNWWLGAYGYTQGFPSCGTFHQDRLVLSGCPSVPQQIDASVVGDYENFGPSDRSTLAVADNSAFSFKLNSKEVNPVQWLASNSQGLLAGTSTAEWAMTAASSTAPLTPTDFSATQTSLFGSANADVVQSGNATMYIQRAQRKLRELNYFFQVGTFRSTDLTVLSEHITIPSITKLALQKETQPLIWAIRSDGALVSMVYDRSDVQVQAGWTRHLLGGAGDAAGDAPSVTSMAFIPYKDTTFDQMWLVVKRWINGATVYNIEYMSRIFDDSMRQDDACQFDCSGLYDAQLTVTNVTVASPAVVTVAAHGLTTGQFVKIRNVVGISTSSTDIDGNTVITSLVNDQVFKVGTTTTNTFELQDQNTGAAFSTLGAAPYVSGGTAAKMVSTITGLTWLLNETVSVLADGGNHPDVVVSNSGGITLQYPAAKVRIGYHYNSDGKTLRADAGAADGTALGKTRRTTRAAFLIHNLGDLAVGTEFTNILPMSFEQADLQTADTAPTLYSGIIRPGLESKYDFESQVCWRQSSGLPGMIQAITLFMEETDV